MRGPSTAKKGTPAGKVPSPGARPSFIMGSRPDTLRAPMPGARIKPGPASTTQYGKPAPPDNVGMPGQELLP